MGLKFTVLLSLLSFSFGAAAPRVLFPDEWKYIGPFPIAKTEFDGDGLGKDPIAVLRSLANDDVLVPEHLLWSETSNGGVTQVQKVRPNTNGRVAITPTQVDWQKLVHTTGSREVLEHQGWCVGKIMLPSSGTYEVIMAHLHTAYILNETTNTLIPFTGDQYGRGLTFGSTYLSSGSLTVCIHVRAQVQAQFSFGVRLLSRGKDWRNLISTFPHHWTPDIVEGYLMGEVLQLIIFNGASDSVYLRFSSTSQQLQIDAERSATQVGPGQLKYVPLFLSKGPKALTCPTKLRISMEGGLSANQSQNFGKHEYSIQCRQLEQSFVYSFVDFDGSPSRAAAIAPPDSVRSLSPARPSLQRPSVPILLTLHGTSISPQDQADSYKRKVTAQSKEYTFGVAGYWLCAPTRHGAHNWEHSGQLSALQAAEALAALTRSLASAQSRLSQLPSANDHYLHYAGHSMGGHGSLLLGTLAPDRAIGVASSAGWIKKEEYGNANTVFLHDFSYTDPSLRSILMKAIVEHDVEHSVGNMCGLNVSLRVGDNDATVSPWFVRKMARLLKLANVNVSFTEFQGKDHWWWDSVVANDGGVNNDRILRTHFRHARQALFRDGPRGHSECEAEEPLENFIPRTGVLPITFFNPASFRGKAGVQPIQQNNALARSYLTLKQPFRESSLSEINTGNVKRVRFDSCSPLFISRESSNHTCQTVSLRIDGVLLDIPVVNFFQVGAKQVVDVCKAKETRWALCEHQQGFESFERSIHTLGPARQVASRPFAIVFGTKSDESKDFLRSAASYIANLHAMTTEGAVTLQDDSLVRTGRETGFIIIGSPFQNRIAPTSNLSPVQWMRDDAFSFRGTNCTFSGPGLGVLYLAPLNSSSDSLALVIAGTDIQGLELATKLAKPTIPPMTRAPFTNLVPDFMVLAPTARAHGYGGVLAAGYWGNDWTFQIHQSYISPDPLLGLQCPGMMNT